MSSARKLGSRSTADDVLAGVDLSGSTILLTGANAGIGFETGRALAAHGATLYAGCRSADKCAQTAERIRALHPDADVRPFVVDLGSLAQIREAVAALDAEALDVVIANAGVYGGGYRETADGFEFIVGVSHIGHALLIELLLPRLEAQGGGRVVMVSSESHRSPKRLQFDRFPLTRQNHKDLVAYGQAKLCNVLFANELQRRFGARGVTANSLHPGALIATSISRDSALAKLAVFVARPFSKSLAQGAATTVYCATAPELDGIGGRYFVDCREKPASAEAQDPEVARRLWEMTETWLGQG